MYAQRTAALLAAGMAVLAAGVAVSCGARARPDVPVYASPVELTLLAGTWRGEYSTVDGRRGHIAFDLLPGQRDATGEAYMSAIADPGRSGAGYGDEGRVTRDRTTSAPIPIEFLWTEDGRVEGRLASFADPQTGTSLRTEFRGTWTGETMDGTFVELDGGRTVREGRWRAARTGGAVADAPPTLADVPSHDELVALGRRVFDARGCAECHGTSPAVAGAVRPGLEAVTEHRTFPWVYNMVVHPDSMLREDPTAIALGRRYAERMRDVSVTPWEALLLYEYLQERAVEAPAGGP